VLGLVGVLFLKNVDVLLLILHYLSTEVLEFHISVLLNFGEGDPHLAALTTETAHVDQEAQALLCLLHLRDGVTEVELALDSEATLLHV
jgi:hypothetical protein